MARPKKHHRDMRQETMTTTQTKTNDDQSKDLTDNRNLTPEERAIVSRVAAETPEWETIREDQLLDYSLDTPILDLRRFFPEAWKEQVEKRYAFRWCERTPKRIDELTRSGSPVTQWKICNKVTTPFLERYVDPVLGCIARLDQILLYRPWERHMIEKRAKEQLAEARANSGKPENLVTKRVSDKIEAQSGPEFKISSRDAVQYEDGRSENEEIGDLVVEE